MKNYSTKDDALRKDVRKLKAINQVSYKELADYISISTSSMYSWLAGHFDFSAERKRLLQDIVQDLYTEE